MLKNTTASISLLAMASKMFEGKIFTIVSNTLWLGGKLSGATLMVEE